LALIEAASWNVTSSDTEGPTDEGGAAEIEAEFRRMLSGLRRLPRHARAAAVRTACNHRFLALKALNEKRQRDRHARLLAWRQRLPTPNPSG
jgi:hypothetical protein